MGTAHAVGDMVFPTPAELLLLLEGGDDANTLEKLTRDNFADYREVFDGFVCTVDSLGPYEYRLTVKNKKNVLVADSYTNFVTVNKQKRDLSSVIIYFPVNKTFYVPKELRDYLLTK